LFALGIAGLVVSVEPASPSLRFDVKGAARRFLVSGEAADLHLRASVRPLQASSGGRLLFDSGGTWRLFEDGDGAHVYRFYDPLAGPAPYKEARITPGRPDGEVFLNPELLELHEPIDPLLFPLDELLFLDLLAVRGGVEMHACGLTDASGKGYLFAGQSEDGKTTTARLWEREPGVVILSDDRIVLRREADGSFRMYGTPWHGDAELAASVSAPLSGVFFLEHGERNELFDTTPVEAVTKLVARSFPPFHSAGPLESTLAFLDGLVAAVPCRRFPFVPNADAVKFIRENAA
jgi:hypothetical protein